MNSTPRSRKQQVLVSTLLVLAAGVATTYAMASAAKPEALGLSDGRLRPCPDTPNCVNSEARAGQAAIEPLRYAGDGRGALRSLVEFLRGEPRVELVSVEPDYVHAVFRSALFRFRDDVEFRLDAVASQIHVRSASRLGYSDLGANRRRVESLRERWVPPSAFE